MAASDHTISFLNGTSTAPVTLRVGTYSFVSTTIPGYASGGNVAQFTVTPTTTSLGLSITGNGTLEVTVKDEDGSSITSGALQLSNQQGDVRYGVEEDIVGGAVTFANVPYGAGISFYMAQNGSDTNHDPLADPQVVDMAQQTQQEAVLNQLKTTSLSFTMADTNYAGITPVTGDLVMNG